MNSGQACILHQSLSMKSEPQGTTVQAATTLPRASLSLASAASFQAFSTASLSQVKWTTSTVPQDSFFPGFYKVNLEDTSRFANLNHDSPISYPFDINTSLQSSCVSLTIFDRSNICSLNWGSLELSMTMLLLSTVFGP